MTESFQEVKNRDPSLTEYSTQFIVDRRDILFDN